MIDELLAYNQRFVEEKRYERYMTGKYPDKKLASGGSAHAGPYAGERLSAGSGERIFVQRRHGVRLGRSAALEG